MNNHKTFGHTFSLFALGAAAMFAMHTSVMAQTVYDGLDYTSLSNLNTQTGGSGWSNAWAVQNGNAYDVLTPGLAFGTLQTTGGLTQSHATFQRAGRRILTNVSSPWYTNNFVSDPFSTGLINQGGDVWFSTLVRREAGANPQMEIVFYDSNTNFSGGDTGDVVINGSNSSFGAELKSMSGSGSVDAFSLSTGITYLLVGRWNFNGEGSSSFHLWAFNNPSSLTLGGADLSLSSATVAMTGLNASDIDFKGFSIYGGSAINQWSFDEFRFGTSFASVTPITVPEPASLALLASAGFVFFSKRRRQQIK